MTENWSIALFTIFGGALLGAYAGIVGGAFLIIQRVQRVETSMEFMLELNGIKASRHQHSPDNHHGLDPLIDLYLQREYELTNEQWQEWFDKEEKIIRDESKSFDERENALRVAALCNHKLRRAPSIVLKLVDLLRV